MLRVNLFSMGVHGNTVTQSAFTEDDRKSQGRYFGYGPVENSFLVI